MHRVDAQQAVGTASGFPADFAADGIDELLMGFSPRASSFPIATTRSIAIQASDTDDHWHVTLGPDGIDTNREGRAGDLTIRGEAGDIYLALWNRGDGGSLEIDGDREILKAWHDHHNIRWDLN